MTTLQLKTGQVAAVVGLTPKQVQNDVDAGYIQPAVAGQGRGSVRLFSLDDVVKLTVLELLVQAYGLERQRAATMLAQVWPSHVTKRLKVLRIPPTPTATSAGLALGPLCLPLHIIRKATEERISQVLTTHRERKRGRPAGWSQQMRQALAEVAEPLQRVSEAQIQDTIEAYRATRRDRARPSTRP
jgi:DNA-binding transcriptional MerR regulator